MPQKEPKGQRIFDVRLPREAIVSEYSWSYMRVLYLLAYDYCYFKDNRLNNYNKSEIARKLNCTYKNVLQAIEYLKQKRLIVTKGKMEYLNPLYCYQSDDKTRRDNIDYILKPIYMVNGETHYDFGLVGLPKEDYEEIW